MRDDLAGETALRRPVEPGGGILLPGARPGFEGDLDIERARRAHDTFGDPAFQRVHGKGGCHGEIHGGALARGGCQELPGLRDIHGQRLLAENRFPRGQGGLHMGDMGGGRRGDIDAVAPGDDLRGALSAGDGGQGGGDAGHRGFRRVPNAADGHAVGGLFEGGTQQPFAHEACAENAKLDRCHENLRLGRACARCASPYRIGRRRKKGPLLKSACGAN